LRSNCTEAIGYILTSVKNTPEICRQDSIEVCQMLLETLINGNLTEADPQNETITNAISQICVCLKDDFKQFLPLFVPALLKDANKDIDFKVKESDDLDGEEEDENGRAALVLKIKGMEGAKQVSMNTNALESKINAVTILKTLARNLGTSFYDWVDEVGKTCIPLINDQYSYALRRQSSKCMRFLIGACKEQPEKQKALFIMTYINEMQELEKRKGRNEYDMMSSILKEIFKQLKNFYHFRDQGIHVFT